MLKKQFLALILATFGVLHLAPASAITLSIDPTPAVIGVGDTYTANINISGLGDGVAPSIGVFDIDLSYNVDAT